MPVSVPVSTLLPPVLVTATRFAEDAGNLPFGVSVLTAQDIRNVGASTVNEALMKLLGLPGRLDFYGGGDYGLDLRGFGASADSNQVVILDGVRITEADLGGTRLAGIPIESVERIEVLRGSAAVLYGEGATGGAIVITTKAGGRDEQRRDGYAYVAMGSQSLLDARAGASLAAGGYALDVSANRRTTAGHRDNFRSSTEGLTATAQWRNEWLRVGVRHGQDDLQTGLPGALTAAEYDANPRQTTHPTDHGSADGQRDAASAEATLGAWQVALDAGNRAKTVVGEYGYTYAYDVEAQDRSARVRHATVLGRMRNTLVAGLDHQTWTRVVRGSFGSTAEQSSKAVYLKDDVTLPSGTHLSAGVRRQSASKTLSSMAGTPVDEHFNAWELGVVQRVGEEASVYARLGRSFRFANADEFSFTSMGTLLKPQTSRDLDLGARWGSTRSRAELRYYRHALHDEIGYDPDAPNVGRPGANVNFADVTLRQGVELEWAHALNRNLQLRVNGALRQARFTSGAYDGRDIALTPRRSLSVGADWALGGGHKLGGVVTTVSSQYPDFANTCRMPATTTADARYAYQRDAVELAVAVGNLTDKKYYTQAFACAGATPTSVYPEAGRSVTLSARVNF